MAKPEPWHEALVHQTRPVSGELRVLVLDVQSSGLAGLYTRPGQYVRASVDGAEEGVFAIASHPKGASRYELLVKRGSAAADALLALPAGAKILLSAPMGQGFPLERARGRRLLLFATGSGISAIRPVIEAVRAERQAFGAVTLFFGVRRPEEFAFQDEIALWQADGIEVVQTVSQPGSSGWEGLTGYVQAHIPERGPLQGAVAFLSGHEAMAEEVSQVLRRQGMGAEDVFLNY